MANEGNKPNWTDGLSEEELDELQKMTTKWFDDAFGNLFGGQRRPDQERKPGGRVFIDGMESFAAEFSPRISISMPGRWKSNMLQETPKVIWEVLLRVWNYPKDWHFGVTHDPAAAVWLVTAQYFDPDGEVEGALVNEAIQITEEEIEKDWEDAELPIENKVSKMKEQCDAELAMFEEGGGDD